MQGAWRAAWRKTIFYVPWGVTVLISLKSGHYEDSTKPGGLFFFLALE